MRIIGGNYKGRKLTSRSGHIIRPTLAKVREAFFDIIGTTIKDRTFLDLYAGTGAMGIEALSRGADTAYFVESSKKTLGLLLKNLALINSNLYVVIKMDAGMALEQMKDKGIKTDIAYMDPPYEDEKAYTNNLSLLLHGGVMNKSFAVGVEHNKAMKDAVCRTVADFRFNTHRYGDTYLTVIRKS